jgi:predicted RND superfamily exporter protein
VARGSRHARVEKALGRWGRLVVRRRGRTIAVCLLFTAWLLSGLPRLTADFSNDNYLLSGDPSRLVYDAFRARYGLDERLMIGIEPTSVFDLEFLERLRAFHTDVEESVPYVEEVLSLVNARLTRGEDDELIVEELMEDWSGDAEGLAVFRERVLSNPLYRNVFISKNHDFTAVTVKPQTWSSLSDEGEDEIGGFEDDTSTGAEFLTTGEIGEMIEALRDVIARHEGPDLRMHLVGREVMGKRMEDIGARDTAVYSVISLVVIAGLLMALFRRVSAALLPLLVVSLSGLSTIGAMAHLGIPFTSMTQILPSFLIAVGVCDSIHLLSIAYRRLAMGDDQATAIAYSIEHSGLAVVLTSVTTAGGLFSFVAAQLSPIAQLGIIAPLGVLLALFYSLTLLPALLASVRLSPPRTSGRGVASGVDRVLARLGDVATGHPRTVLAATALVLLVSVLGVRQVHFSMDVLSWLMDDEPVRVSIERIDEAFEGIGDVQVLVDSRRENGLHDPDVLRRLDAAVRFARELRTGPVSVGGATSIADVVKEINLALHENRPEHYALPNERALIAQELLLFENSGSDDLEDVTDSRFQEARIALRTTWADGLFYVPFLEELETGMAEILGDDLSAQITGGRPLSARAFSLLLPSLARSYALALLVITPLMVLMIGNVKRGLLAMIPNLIPVYLTLAIMGFFSISMNMSTLMVGSIIIGIAVDDTIHFMQRFNHYYAATGDAAVAVRETLETTGVALLVTSLALTASFLVFLMGNIWALVHFGVMAAIATGFAFVADVLVAPALMVLATRRR